MVHLPNRLGRSLTRAMTAERHAQRATCRTKACSMNAALTFGLWCQSKSRMIPPCWSFLCGLLQSLTNRVLDSSRFYRTSWSLGQRWLFDTTFFLLPIYSRVCELAHTSLPGLQCHVCVGGLEACDSLQNIKQKKPSQFWLGSWSRKPGKHQTFFTPRDSTTLCKHFAIQPSIKLHFSNFLCKEFRGILDALHWGQVSTAWPHGVHLARWGEGQEELNTVHVFLLGCN